MNEQDDGPPFEPDDIRSLIEAEHPGGWRAYNDEWNEQIRREKELLARSPWRRLEKRIEQLAHDAGIGTELARKLVEDRLAVEIAEAVAQEFRLEVGLKTAQVDLTQVVGKTDDGRTDEVRVATPYLNVGPSRQISEEDTQSDLRPHRAGQAQEVAGVSCLPTSARDMLDEFLKGQR